MGPVVRTVISPSRYVQGKGAISERRTYLKQIGSTPLMVADDLVWGFVAHDVGASLAAAGLPLHRENFNGIPTAREVDRLDDQFQGVAAETRRGHPRSVC